MSTIDPALTSFRDESLTVADVELRPTSRGRLRDDADATQAAGSPLYSPRNSSLVHARNPWRKSRSVEGEKLALEEGVAGCGALDRGAGSMSEFAALGKPPLDDEALAVTSAGGGEVLAQAVVERSA